MGRNFLLAVATILPLAAVIGTAQDAADYARLLPHISPKEPQDALECFVLADDRLRIELVAAEPLLRDPIASRARPPSH
jgi:hypothetical protein